ncbi:MAG: coenzyme F420-0:L-glutamate ligase [Candidatus Gracilibacteria bacterium]|nr:coenzyme F420-0:L-glutamate ligase [Candidatus Gracilibacteria bacterium]
MQFLPIKTRPINPPKDDLMQIIDEYITEIKDSDIIFITSKVVAIGEGNCVKNDSKISKKDLVFKDADNYLKKDVVPGRDIYLTIKNNILIPSAGIDESNANGYFILWPKDLKGFSKKLHYFLCKKFNVKNLGIVITDSTTRPLKWGVSGIGIYSYGFKPLIDKRGQKDIFGKNLEITQINVLDAITPMAVYLMGEGSETTPILVARDIPNIVYDTDETLYDKMLISPEMDLYGELLKPLIK